MRPTLPIALAFCCVTAGAAAPAAMKPSPQALALARAVRDNRAEAKGVQAQIAHLKSRLVTLGAVEAAGERGAGGKRARLDRLNQQEAELTAKLGVSQNDAARLLGAMVLFRRDPPPALLVHPASAQDAVRAQILARALQPDLQAKSRALQTQLQALRAIRRQVDSASEDLLRSDSALAEQKAEIEQLLADKTALERSLVADAETAEARLRDLAARSQAPADLLQKLPSGEESLGPPPQRMIEPVQGRLAARYGQAAWPQGPSEGLAWKALAGAPVLAPAGGIIEYAGPLKDYGVVLILRTGGAYHLVLAGLGAADALAGQSVGAGEPIGRMGDAGPVSALYLEVRRGGEPVDPRRWFKVAAGAAPLGRSVR